MERLQKVIASAGITSRRKAEELITSGKVMVNGEIVTELGIKVSSKDEIIVDGMLVNMEPLEYYLLNKPRGTISTTADELGRKNICDLIETNARIYPVGRLDYNTTGIILLTNDGNLANILMHPSNAIPKTYLAKIEGNLTMAELFTLKDGINIDNVKTKATRVKIKKRDLEKKSDLVEITITEGRNHIVKRMFEGVHHDVQKLTRTKYAFLSLDNLSSGEYRKLSKEEIKKLYELKKRI